MALVRADREVGDDGEAEEVENLTGDFNLVVGSEVDDSIDVEDEVDGLERVYKVSDRAQAASFHLLDLFVAGLVHLALELVGD